MSVFNVEEYLKEKCPSFMEQYTAQTSSMFPSIKLSEEEHKRIGYALQKYLVNIKYSTECAMSWLNLKSARELKLCKFHTADAVYDHFERFGGICRWHIH